MWIESIILLDVFLASMSWCNHHCTILYQRTLVPTEICIFNHIQVLGAKDARPPDNVESMIFFGRDDDVIASVCRVFCVTPGSLQTRQTRESLGGDSMKMIGRDPLTKWFFQVFRCISWYNHITKKDWGCTRRWRLQGGDATLSRGETFFMSSPGVSTAKVSLKVQKLLAWAV